MTDKKEQEEPQAQNLADEMAGLAEEVVDQESTKGSLLDKLGSFKKYLIPAGIAIGASAITMVIFLVFFGNSKVESEPIEQTEQVAEHSDVEHAPASDNEADEHHNNATEEGHSVEKINLNKPVHENQSESHNNELADDQPSESYLDSLNAMVFEPVDLSKYDDIDTNEIMDELSFLYATPEDEFADDGLTPEDSVDTLNWLEKRMLELSDKENDLAKREAELNKLQRRVGAGLEKINQVESTRLANLARLYDGMKPDEVAKLFANLSDEVVIALIPRMKPANAAKILAMMPSRRAAKLSTQMITVLEDN